MKEAGSVGDVAIREDMRGSEGGVWKLRTAEHRQGGRDGPLRLRLRLAVALGAHAR